MWFEDNQQKELVFVFLRRWKANTSDALVPATLSNEEIASQFLQIAPEVNQFKLAQISKVAGIIRFCFEMVNICMCIQ